MLFVACILALPGPQGLQLQHMLAKIVGGGLEQHTPPVAGTAVYDEGPGILGCCGHAGSALNPYATSVTGMCKESNTRGAPDYDNWAELQLVDSVLMYLLCACS